MNDTIAQFHYFYQSLNKKENIIYMFFTTGMLFWAIKAISFIPDTVNLVLICAGMDASEIKWITEKWTYPTFFIKEHWNDKQVHQMLFKVNEKNYGWIDCDCFVLNPAIFNEMTVMDKQTSVNVCWASTDKLSNRILLNTYFIFINANVIRHINNLSLNISPGLYIYPADQLNGRTFPAKPDTIQPCHMPYISHFNGAYPKQFSEDVDDGFFDTLLLFQFVSEGLGYGIKRIRRLSHDYYMSDELLHVGGSSSFSHFGNKSETSVIQKYQFNSPVFHMAAYLLLAECASELPQLYKKKLLLLRKLYEMNGKSNQMIRSEIAAFFQKNNLSKGTIDKLFSCG